MRVAAGIVGGRSEGRGRSEQIFLNANNQGTPALDGGLTLLSWDEA